MKDDSNKFMDIDALIDKHDGNAKTKVSEKKLIANRANAGKSTGPRTAEGKKRSSQNSLKHGLLARTVLFDDKGEPDAEFLSVYHALREQYATANVAMVLRLDVLLTDYWRMVQATKAEAAFIRTGGVKNLGTDWAQKVHRYRTASQNSFMKSLDIVEKLRAKQEDLEDLEDADADEEGAEPDLCVNKTEDPEGTKPAMPTVDREIQQTAAEEVKTAATTELPPYPPAESLGQDQPTAAPDHRDGVPEPDLPPRKNTE
jgi:hypothetical protein